MHRTLAALGAGILVATLMVACRPQYVAPGTEIRALTRSLRVHGLTVRVPADLREEGIVERHPARVGGAALRRFESMAANRPRAVVRVTADRAAQRTVVLIIGRIPGDSALVRRMSETVQPFPREEHDG